MRGYPSVQTYTLQSSFKYDQPLEKTKKAIEVQTGPAKRKDLEIIKQHLNLI